MESSRGAAAAATLIFRGDERRAVGTAGPGAAASAPEATAADDECDATSRDAALETVANLRAFADSEEARIRASFPPD